MRVPLERYVFSGVLPADHPELMAMLCGDLTTAVQIYGARYPATRTPLPMIMEAVEAVSDLCLGHPVYVARWHQWGGLNGRPPQ
jgi:hypothetical protein